MRYEEPKMTVIVLEFQDVITGSNGMDSEEVGSDGGNKFGQ